MRVRCQGKVVDRAQAPPSPTHRWYGNQDDRDKDDYNDNGDESFSSWSLGKIITYEDYFAPAILLLLAMTKNYKNPSLQGGYLAKGCTSPHPSLICSVSARPWKVYKAHLECHPIFKPDMTLATQCARIELNAKQPPPYISRHRNTQHILIKSWDEQTFDRNADFFVMIIISIFRFTIISAVTRWRWTTLQGLSTSGLITV